MINSKKVVINQMSDIRHQRSVATLSTDYCPLPADYWKKLTIKTFYIEKKARTLLSQYMYPNEETIRKYFTSGFAIRSTCL